MNKPRVGLLSNGEEAGKGSALVKETYEMLSTEEWESCGGASFAGNVEGRDLLLDSADVIVTDGFTGNVLLKTAEGVFSVITKAILAASESSDDARAGAKLFSQPSWTLTRRSIPTTPAGRCCWA